jgi:osmotically-inducible protein OsmY
MAQASEISTPTAYPDLDIREAIYDRMVGFPPVMHDRHRLHIEVQNGVAIVKGYVNTEITRSLLVERILSGIDGLVGVDTKELYDDDTILRSASRFIPLGIFMNVQYGAVILSGKLPEGMTAQELVNQIATVPGVNRILTNLQNG